MSVQKDRFQILNWESRTLTDELKDEVVVRIEEETWNELTTATTSFGFLSMWNTILSGE